MKITQWKDARWQARPERGHWNCSCRCYLLKMPLIRASLFLYRVRYHHTPLPGSSRRFEHQCRYFYIVARLISRRRWLFVFFFTRLWKSVPHLFAFHAVALTALLNFTPCEFVFARVRTMRKRWGEGDERGWVCKARSLILVYIMRPDSERPREPANFTGQPVKYRKSSYKMATTNVMPRHVLWLHSKLLQRYTLSFRIAIFDQD